MNAFIDRGATKPSDVKIVWQSGPLPNDPLVVRVGFDPAMTKKVQDIVLAITEEQALTLMPKNYTGWAPATHADYKLIEDAGVSVGRLKPKMSVK